LDSTEIATTANEQSGKAELSEAARGPLRVVAMEEPRCTFAIDELAADLAAAWNGRGGNSETPNSSRELAVRASSAAMS